MTLPQSAACVRYAVPLDCCLPNDLPSPDAYPFSASAGEWYAVVVVYADENTAAAVEDVRRVDWPLPNGVTDWRTGRHEHVITLVCTRMIEDDKDVHAECVCGWRSREVRANAHAQRLGIEHVTKAACVE